VGMDTRIHLLPFLHTPHGTVWWAPGLRRVYYRFIHNLRDGSASGTTCGTRSSVSSPV
jgi:hypothetical protein